MDEEDGNVEQLGDAEHRAVQALDQELREHLELTQDLFNFISEALVQLPEARWRDLSQSRKVVTALLIRLGNDLRCASMLAIHGYPAQAGGLVATMCEIAYTVAFIGADDSRAEAWIKHDDPRKPFKDAFTLTRDGMAAIGLADANAQPAQYRVYRQLCMAKHANPLFEMPDAFVLSRCAIRFTNGPRSSALAVRAARFALEHAAGLSTVALIALIQNHARGSTQEELRKAVVVFDERLKRLREESARRYPEGDPFPGKW
jgi:hypothetical protein